MRKSKPKIADKKKRGEWVELRFMARAAEHDLPACKPLGDSENFDVVVGRPGKFAAVQVKCTVFRSKNGDGYVCSVCSSHKVYKAGAFDFLAAYVVPEDVWFIVPASAVAGMRSITLCTPEGKYEKYREAWELLREAVGSAQDEAGAVGEAQEDVHEEAAEELPVAEEPVSQFSPLSAFGRMETAMKQIRDRLSRPSFGRPGLDASKAREEEER